MKLSKEEQEVKELGQMAKEFLEGKLFKHLQQHLSNQLDKEYPKPDKPGWEDQYRYAKAYEAAAAEIVNFLISLKSSLAMLNEKEKSATTSIEDA